MGPTSVRIASTTNQEALQNRQDRLKKPLQGAYPQKKDRSRNAMRAHFELLSRNKIQWFLGPCSTEVSKAGRSETSAARGNQGPSQPRLSHRAAISTKQERADSLTRVVPFLETES